MTSLFLQLQKVALALLCLSHHSPFHSVDASSSPGGVVASSTQSESGSGSHLHRYDHHDNNNDVQEFTPPKLSFTAADYFASLKDDNVVNSVQHLDDHDAGVDNNVSEETGEVSWTIFQAVPTPIGDIAADVVGEDAAAAAASEEASAQREKEAIRRRSGPLLTLFPDAVVSADSTTSGGIIGAANNSNKRAKHAVLTPAEQRAYLAIHGELCHRADGGDASDDVVKRYDLFRRSPTLTNLAAELWKYCALYVEGGIYVDAETAPLVALGDVLDWDHRDGSGGRKNYAVVAFADDAGVSPSLLPGSVNEDGSESSISDTVTTASSLGTGNPVGISSVVAVGSKKHSVPRKMMEALMETDAERLEVDALLLPKKLIELIREDEANRATSGKSSEWGLLKQRCNGIEVARGEGSYRTLRHCNTSSGYCCDVLDPEQNFVFLLSRQSLVPNQILPRSSTLPRPYNARGKDGSDSSNATAAITTEDLGELPFRATIREETSSETESFAPGSSSATPNVHELLSAISALPNQESNMQACMDCLREKKAADCNICRDRCPNFCDKVCDLDVKEKPVKRVLSVEAPKYRKDPERLIPRIVHQTWFETVTPEKYPNMSRLIESWKHSGWTYHFWDDASAAQFLSLHFPPEVREAYDSILPGAFKADLFRYCVLLIQGGIYADMDVMLESRLDAAVPPDVGFMVPVDAPGIKPDKRMCLWNGFIASAPAHPYLARVIERVVNNIRNRFTVVDYDRMMCPDPEFSVTHAFSTLFTAGPCVLGMTVNEVTGRDLQHTFLEGDLEMPEVMASEAGVPGRTIILQQNKWDMGAHRFTWVENNLVVAATDMPDYDDRKDLEGEDEEQASHYSKTLDRNNLYGEGKVYVNRDIAHERIVIKTQ